MFLCNTFLITLNIQKKKNCFLKSVSTLLTTEDLICLTRGKSKINKERNI